MDRMSVKKRSHVMSCIRGKNIGPEIAVRRMLHNLGYRFRLHVRNLPGSPDIVLPKYRTAVMVHGCFWHRHNRCQAASEPKSNVVYWQKKFKRNAERDKENILELKDAGWKVIVIWECQTKNERMLRNAVHKIKTRRHNESKS